MKVERIAQKITGAIGQGGKKLTAKASAAAQTAKKGAGDVMDAMNKAAQGIKAGIKLHKISKEIRKAGTAEDYFGTVLPTKLKKELQKTHINNALEEEIKKAGSVEDYFATGLPKKIEIEVRKAQLNGTLEEKIKKAGSIENYFKEILSGNSKEI